MKKARKYLTILLIITFLISPLKINAAETLTGTATGTVSIKSGPGDNYETITTVSRGKSLTLASTQKYSSTSGCAANWYKIYYNNAERYICSSYLNLANTSINYFTTDTWEARTTSNSLNVRSKASSSGSYITALSFGTEVKIKQELASGNGCDDKWYQISYHNNKTGYVCSTYVVKRANVTVNDAAYNEVLKNKGFPESYWPYLNYLHKKHPTWNFEAIKTNINFRNAIDGEEGKNYIQTSLSAYRTSSTPVEGSTWFTATNSVIAFYLDPRNFLLENSIFMFENLGFDEKNHTKEVIKTVFGSGTLGNDIYLNAFLNAGAKYKISPIHLASRVKQEVGINGNLATSGDEFTWNNTKYKGFYNFFNIGAYGTDPLTRGLAYAAGLLGDSGNELPWNSIEKAINGGASFLSKAYTSQGQYTLYFQKFNVSPTSAYSKYTHQYMTNVNAPTAEGISTYKSYVSNKLIETGYSFSIPIYGEMPEDSVTLPSIGNNNNDLASIKINGIELNNFDKDVIEYNYDVSNTTSKVKLEATPATNLSKIDMLKEIELKDIQTSINITVISESGLSKTYTIIINKVSENNTTIENQITDLGYLINNTTLTSIPELTTTNTIANQIKSKMPNATISIKDSNNRTLTNTDTLKTNDIININNGEFANKYTIVIKGDTSGDGKITILDLLETQKHILKSTLLTNSYVTAADVNYDNKVTILDLLLIQKHILKLGKIK